MERLKIGFSTAVSVVVASMIGTGVFTSLGFQLSGTSTVFAILLLWVLGGIMSLCGALVYGEIGAAFPQSGGEYNYLSKLYHPYLGFLSGWVSATVGFAAPVALAAMALGKYTQSVFPTVNEEWLAILTVVLLTAIHAYNLKWSAGFQRIATYVKIAFITAFILTGFFVVPQHSISILPTSQSWSDIFSGGFAVSLFWVTYSYSGWNASAYITGELKNPARTLPRSLFTGTLLVTVLYVLLNYIFLYSTPASDMAGQVEIGYISGKHIFGPSFGSVIGLIIAFLLVSSISAMTLSGPRVIASIGGNVPMLKAFSVRNKHGVPYVAVISQSLISLLLIKTATFNLVLELIGFILTVFTFLTVAGVFILRTKFKDIPRPYKTWGYPATPLIFLLINSWILFYGFSNKIEASLYGLGILAVGSIVWIVGKYHGNKANPVSQCES